MTTSHKKCLDCQHYTRVTQEEGECRWHPPVVTALKNNNDVLTLWPVVRPVDWCGQWALRPINLAVPQK